MIYYIPFIGFIVALVEHSAAAREHRAALDLLESTRKTGTAEAIMQASNATWPVYERVNQAFGNFAIAMASTFFALIVMQAVLHIASQNNVDNG